MNLLYNIGARAYFLGIKLAAAFGHRKARLMEEGRRDWAVRLTANVNEVRQRLGHEPRFVWFHAASLGEFEQGRPLIEALRERYPECQILQTFFSPSGYEVRKNYKGADVICYLPYDRKADCCRFLDIVKPERAIFVKYEFWGNILEQLRQRDIPTYLVSGIFRRRQSFFQWYGGLFRPVLGCFRHLFVQDEESRRLLASIGYDSNVTICGDTRFDRVISVQKQAKRYPWAESFRQDHFVLVAGSSWPKDEDILLDFFNRHPEMRLIIAPHEIHEEHIQSIIAKLKRPYIRYSEMKKLWEDGSVADNHLPAAGDFHTVGSGNSGEDGVAALIIDAIGFLSSIYRYGDVAYIGGGFGVGIHNTLEAAVYGMPVVFGPNYSAFREALGLIDSRGGFPIVDAAQYESVMDRFLTDATALEEAGKAAGEYVQSESGATDLIFKSIF